jgi:hypothetical protein
VFTASMSFLKEICGFASFHLLDGVAILVDLGNSVYNLCLHFSNASDNFKNDFPLVME